MAKRRSLRCTIGSAGAAIALLPLAALAECSYDVPTGRPVDIDDLWEMTEEPACTSQLDELAMRVDADPTLLVVQSDLDPEHAQDLRSLAFEYLQMRRLKAALALGDRDDALQRIEKLLATADPRSDAHAVLSADADRDDAMAEGPARPGIIDILEGEVLPAPRPMPVVEANWELSFGWCGTPAMSWYHEASNAPSAADAWLGVKRPDLALNALLADQWVDGLSLGMTPPRLRDFAERFMGPGTYEREVERALAGIQILEGPDGRRATLPMFGELLPVPLGYRTWNAPEPTIFHTPGQIANYLRPLLLQGEWH